MKTYDVLVLGGGTAGTAAARAAHGAGARTAMFNEGELGGLCILRGCMPTKTMLHAAHLVHAARHHATRGVGSADLDVAFAEIMANKDAKVARFQRAKIDSIEAAGYDVVDARARFTGPDTVEAGGESYRFTRGAVVSTGSVASLPRIPGVEDTPYWTSDSLMEVRERPDSVIVVGSGAIGIEFAQFFARLGTQVHLVSRRRVFIDADPVIADEMEAILRDEPNLTSHREASPLAVRRTGDGVEIDVEMPGGRRESIAAERLILATGRHPDLDGLGLESAGVRIVAGKLAAGADMRTTNPRVFAAGDASGDRLLLHVANWEGRVAGLGAAQVPGEHRVEQRLHMEVVFFDPPLAMIGMNAAAARAAGHEVVTANARLPETGRAITMDVEHGAFKLVADARTGEILGAQLLGPRADDLVHTIAAIMYLRGTAAQMLEMPWYHPTLSEVLLGLARDIEARRTGAPAELYEQV